MYDSGRLKSGQEVKTMPREPKRPLYQKRHYEDFARLIRDADVYDKNKFIAMIIDLFTGDNPNFDIYRFIKACDNK